MKRKKKRNRQGKEGEQFVHTTMFMFIRVIQAVLSAIAFPPPRYALGLVRTLELRPEHKPVPVMIAPVLTTNTILYL